MEKTSGQEVDRGSALASPVPAGAVALSGERLRDLAPHWDLLSRGLRQMDELDLGEVEPALHFIWGLEG